MGSAARLLQRRFNSLFCQNRSHFPIPQGLEWPFRVSIGFRGVHTETDSLSRANDDSVDLKPCSDEPKPATNSVEMLTDEDHNVKYTAFSNLKPSKRHDLAMIFTCKVCETRSVKTVSRESYEKGVVVARCGGCNNIHLIADRLGWFGQPGSVEDFLAARGEEVRKGSVDTLNLTIDDLVGTKSS